MTYQRIRVMDHRSRINDHPWRCLCLGLSQITKIRPFLRTILHFLHMGFTEALTFMILLVLSVRHGCGFGLWSIVFGD